MKTVYILFGEMGCGKTYCGSRYAEKHNFKFFEGDSVVTSRMMNKIKNFKPLTRDIIEEYIDILSNAIADRMLECDNLVVSQALYCNEDRESLKLFLESMGIQVVMWWVQVPLWRNIQNLLTRDKGWKWICYWLFNKPFFQKPIHEYNKFPNTYR